MANASARSFPDPDNTGMPDFLGNVTEHDKVYKNPCSKHIIDLYKLLEHYCEVKKQTHWMSSKYYEKMERIFTIPSILITTLSGIASFIASTEVPGDTGQISLSISVGVMASISTLLQSFSNAYGLSS